MISIKKYLERTEQSKEQPKTSDDVSAAALRAYRSTLLLTADHAAHACPASGRELQDALKRIADELLKCVTAAAVDESVNDAEAQLQQWSKQTELHLRQKASEARELLLVLAKAGQEAYDRDQRYAGQFGEITRQLNSIAHLDDLTQIRSVVIKSTEALKNSTSKMSKDGEESLTRLKAELSSYQSRLEEAELVASRDALTGVRSRLNVEEQIARRLEHKKAFSIIMLDLNGFKQVNDSYGHAAGDDLLKQFSKELSSVSRSSDIVGRWGGDEFMVVVDGPLKEAQLRVQRLRDWVCGEYTLESHGQKVKVQLGASIGVAEAMLADTASDVVKRADAAMYQEKKAVQGGR